MNVHNVQCIIFFKSFVFLRFTRHFIIYIAVSKNSFLYKEKLRSRMMLRIILYGYIKSIVMVLQRFHSEMKM